ncbi:hypothetical protein DRQ20_03535 [bacterium]|nr:MAG: hypothetical protein DRQ20_03535 [bacterium]
MGPKDNLFVWTFDHGNVTSCLRIIDISDPVNPVEVGHLYMPGMYLDIEKDEGYVYLAGKCRVAVIDIQDIANPFMTGKCRIPGMVMSMKKGTQVLNLLFYYDTEENTSTFRLVNISDPYNPQLFPVTIVLSQGSARRFSNGNYTYIIYESSGIVDKIKYETLIGEYIPPGGVAETGKDVDVWMYSGEDSILWVTEGERGIHIVNPRDMSFITRYRPLPECVCMESYIKSLDEIYVATDSGLFIIDASDVLNCRLIARYRTSNKPKRVFCNGDYAFIVENGGLLEILDVSDPYNPSLLSAYFTEDKKEIVDIEISYPYIYMITYKRDSIVSLCLMDRDMVDIEFTRYIDNITFNRGIFWMQQCFSGGFIDDLENENTVILTACKYNETAHPADNKDERGKFYLENEEWQPGDTCHHGEFNFHVMNAVRQTEIWPYDNPSPVPADLDGNRHTSMWEAFQWVEANDSWYRYRGLETPQYSDPGNIGSSTYLVWDDFAPPELPGIEGYYFKPVENAFGCEVEFIPSPEPDFSGYRLYKEGELVEDTHTDTVSFPIYEFVPGTTDVYSLSGYDVYGYESKTRDFIIRLPIYIASQDQIAESLDLDYHHLFGYQDAYGLVFASKLYTPTGTYPYIIYAGSRTGDSWRECDTLSAGWHPAFAFSFLPSYVTGLPWGEYHWNIAYLYRPPYSSYLYLIGLHSKNRESTPSAWDTVILATMDVSQAGNGYPSLKYPTLYAQGRNVHLVYTRIMADMRELIYRKYYHDWTPASEFETVPIACTGYPKPVLTVDMNGTPHVAVVVNGKIYYSYRSPAGWTEGVEISSEAEDVHLSSVGDKIYVVWSYGTDIYWLEGNIAIFDPLERWRSEPVKISRDKPVSNPRMVQGMYLVWEEDGEIVVADTTGTVIFYTSSPAIKRNPHAVWMGGDSLYLVWREKGGYLYIKPEKIEIPVVPALYSITVGLPQPSPFNLARDGYIEYPSGVKVDYGEDSLVYLLPELVPGDEYTVEIVLYHESSGTWGEKIKIDGRKARTVQVEAGVPETVGITIPYPYYREDGEVKLSITRKRGDYVSVASIKVFKETDRAFGPGGPLTAGNVSTVQGFYVKTVKSLNENAIIEYAIPEDSRVRIEIYNVMGRRVKVHSVYRTAGVYKYSWKGTPGVYFYKVRAGGEEAKGKFIILR